MSSELEDYFTQLLNTIVSKGIGSSEIGLVSGLEYHKTEVNSKDSILKRGNSVKLGPNIKHEHSLIITKNK